MKDRRLSFHQKQMIAFTIIFCAGGILLVITLLWIINRT